MFAALIVLCVLCAVLIAILGVVIYASSEESKRIVTLARRALNMAHDLESKIHFAWIDNHLGKTTAIADYDRAREHFGISARNIDKELTLVEKDLNQ